MLVTEAPEGKRIGAFNMGDAPLSINNQALISSTPEIKDSSVLLSNCIQGESDPWRVSQLKAPASSNR